MAGEYDQRFDEMMGLLRKTADGVDDLRIEVRDMRSGLREATAKIEQTTARVQGNTIKIEGNTIKIEHLTGRFEDAAKVVIKDTQRIASLEQRVDALESEGH